MMKPAKIAKPPASTPNTPDARSPSAKKLPSGALRRTRSIAAIVATLAAKRMTMLQRRLMGAGCLALRSRRPRSQARLYGFLGVLTVAELNEPASKLPVDGLRPDELLLGQLQFCRVEQKRERLRAAHSAVGSNELLEGGHLVRVLPVGAVDHDVGAVREAVGAPHVARGVGPEGGQWILSIHALL